jgi:hypothetical protein
LFALLWGHATPTTLNLLAWLDSLANITNQHHTYNEFLQFFLGIETFILFCLLTLFSSYHTTKSRSSGHDEHEEILFTFLFLYFRSLAGSDWSVRLITEQYDYKQVTAKKNENKKM